MNNFSQALLKTILKTEVSPNRFERFSKDVVAKIEGNKLIVLTSPSWDLGRDARSAAADDAVIVCASLSDKVTDKVINDVNRVVSTTSQIDSLYFLSSQELTEYSVEKIKSELAPLLPKESNFSILGSNHISQLVVERWPEMVERYYPGELQDIKMALFSPDEQSDEESQALKLALSVSPSSNTEEVRDKIYDTCLYQVFSDKKPRTVAAVARDLSAFLRTGKNLPSDLVEHRVEKLRISGALEVKDGIYAITDAGLREIEDRDASAMRNIITGRNEIIEALEEELGQKLIQEQRDQIWKVLKDRLAWLFYARGQEMLSTMSELLNDAEQGRAEDVGSSNSAYDFQALVEELGEAVSGVTSNPEQAKELRTAIEDLFSQKVGAAFDWLVQTCVAFVSACSLGLEVTTGKAIAGVLSRMTLVLDTDVVLSLLNEGEADHDSVESLVKRWKALGGNVVTARQVLKEVAHHAWIAEHDYQNVRDLLPGSKLDRARYISNSFVRGFAELVAQGRAKYSHWRQYIGQYKGANDWDERAAESVVVNDYGIEVMAPPSTDEESLKDNVFAYLRLRAERIENNRLRRNAIDKSRRDAELYASLIRRIKAERKRSVGVGCYLVSSARRLQEIENRFGESGERKTVVSIASVLYMLSLVPGVSLGLNAMKAFLFETRGSVFDSRLDQLVLRLIKSSNEATLPWAKRTTLMNNLRRRIVDRSARYENDGLKTDYEEEMAWYVKSENGAERFAEDLKQSLDSVAADFRTEKRNRELVNRISELERELERLKKGR